MKMGSVLAMGLVLATSAVQADSNYPSDFCHQTVRVVRRGAALFASVGSGCLSAVVFGYQKSGPLAANNPDSINMVITGSCKLSSGKTVSLKSDVPLGKEWNGTGYMSTQHTPYEFLPTVCSTLVGSNNPQYLFQIAFSDNKNNRDPGNGVDIEFDSLRFTKNDAELATKTDGSQINLPAWAFIIDQMRKTP